ncbi:MAG TPA: response regulator transcription factor [Bacteroidales bacterium]|nr:response regulator transcription factor [Bacteroidales bacterium]
MAKSTILLVDDETDILEFLSYNLEKAGFTVFTATNGKEGIRKAREIKPEMIILDIMMPEMDGIETCDKMRNDPDIKHTVILFLTARSEDYSQIAGFDAGADDYVSKPINPRVLTSRVKALLKRKHTDNKVQAEQSSHKTIIIDKDKYEVRKEDKVFVLPRKEFELLSLLSTVPEKVYTRDEIYSNVWGDSFVGDRTIDVHIRKLREKLGKEHIITVKGVGYKFVD